MSDVEDLNVLRRYPRATCEVAMSAFATGENSEVASLVTEKTDGTYRPTDDSYFPRRARVALASGDTSRTLHHWFSSDCFAAHSRCRCHRLAASRSCSGCCRRRDSCSLQVLRWCKGGCLTSRSRSFRREPKTIP